MRRPIPTGGKSDSGIFTSLLCVIPTGGKSDSGIFTSLLCADTLPLKESTARARRNTRRSRAAEISPAAGEGMLEAAAGSSWESSVVAATRCAIFLVVFVSIKSLNLCLFLLRVCYDVRGGGLYEYKSQQQTVRSWALPLPTLYPSNTELSFRLDMGSSGLTDDKWDNCIVRKRILNWENLGF